MLRKPNTSQRAAMRECVLFKDLDEAQFVRLVACARVHDIDAGATLFEQSQPAHHLYQLTSGQIKLSLLSIDGDEKVIDIISPPQPFAEAVIFGERRRYPVNAVALLPSQAVAIEGRVFLQLLRESVDACFDIMARMSIRLHWLVDEVDRLTLHNATYRVITYLLDEVPENTEISAELCLTAPKNVVASRLSIKPETFSRTLKRLTEKKMIEVSEEYIVLRDIPRMRRLISLETEFTLADIAGRERCPAA